MADSRTILERWEISAAELTQAIDENPSLRGMLLGYVAEYKLRTMWFHGRPHVSAYVKHDDHNRRKNGDLVVTYHGQEFIVESKSLQTNTVTEVEGGWSGRAQCDASDRRDVTFPDGSTLSTTCLWAGEFDILAVNLFAFENKWRFIFAKNSDLPRSRFRNYTEAQRALLVASLVDVSRPSQAPFRDEPFSLMDEIIAARSASVPSGGRPGP